MRYNIVNRLYPFVVLQLSHIDTVHFFDHLWFYIESICQYFPIVGRVTKRLTACHANQSCVTEPVSNGWFQFMCICGSHGSIHFRILNFDARQHHVRANRSRQVRFEKINYSRLFGKTEFQTFCFQLKKETHAFVINSIGRFPKRLLWRGHLIGLDREPITTILKTLISSLNEQNFRSQLKT